jgi:signal transduction histidine kinase/CheY-like chemotaxis protein
MTTRLVLQTIKDIIEEEDFDVLINVLAKNLRWLLDFERLMLAIVDDEESYSLYNLFDSMGLCDNSSLFEHPIPHHQGICGMAILDGKHLQFSPSNPYQPSDDSVTCLLGEKLDEKLGLAHYNHVLAIVMRKSPFAPIRGVLVLASSGAQPYSSVDIETLNVLCAHLSLSLERIQANRLMDQEIERRKIAEKQLIEAKCQAEEASIAKSVFLSRMSHELRTPLNAVIGFAQLQQLRQAKKKEVDKSDKASVEHILHAGRHLLMLVNDILDVVQLEQNVMEIVLSDCRLSPAIEQSIALISTQAADRDITIINVSTPVSIIAHHGRLKQVLINLLSNAIKYSPKGSVVELQVSEVADNSIDIRIVDNGIGIALADQQAIFEPFTRLPYAEQHEVQGMGIGLALSKFLVEQMKGAIEVQSVVGQGTTFVLNFPQGEVGGAEVVQSTEIKEVIEPKARPSGSTILYIEDDQASRELLIMTLNGNNEHRFLTANTAEEGLNIANKYQPSLILIDINLPKMSGIEVLKFLRVNPNLRDSQMIALSADALPDQIDLAMAAGFDDYLTKPVDFERINEIIARL